MAQFALLEPVLDETRLSDASAAAYGYQPALPGLPDTGQFIVESCEVGVAPNKACRRGASGVGLPPIDDTVVDDCIARGGIRPPSPPTRAARDRTRPPAHTAPDVGGLVLEVRVGLDATPVSPTAAPSGRPTSMPSGMPGMGH